MSTMDLVNCNVCNADFAVRVTLIRHIKTDCVEIVTFVLIEYKLSYKLGGHIF